MNKLEIFYQMPKGNTKFNKMSAWSRMIWMFLYDLYRQSESNKSKKFYSAVRKEYYCCCDSNILAEYMCISKPTVLKCIKELETNGFIEVERVRKAGNKYFFKSIHTEERNKADDILDSFSVELDNEIGSFFKYSKLPERWQNSYKKHTCSYLNKIKELCNEIKDYDFVKWNGGSNAVITMYLRWLKGTSFIETFGMNTLEIDSKPFKEFCKTKTNEKIEPKEDEEVEEPEQEKKETNYKPSEEKIYVDGYDVTDFIETQRIEFKESIKFYPDKKDEIYNAFKDDPLLTRYSFDYDLDDEDDDYKEDTISETSNEKLNYIMNHPELW